MVKGFFLGFLLEVLAFFLVLIFVHIRSSPSLETRVPPTTINPRCCWRTSSFGGPQADIGQFALSLGKESPFIFSKFNPLNTDTPLVPTVSLAPSVYRINGVRLWLYVRVCYSHKAARYPKHSARSATRHQYLSLLFGRNNKIQKRRQITGKHGPVSHTSQLLEFHFARILDFSEYLA